MAKPSRFDWFFRAHMPDEDRPLSAELRFAEALAELPAIERSALALSEIGGLGTEEIAQRLGTDAVVVRKVLARARESVRATIAERSRRSLTALIPFQNWWSTGSAAPVVRTAGAVAAAVIGTGVAIGGAAADPPRAVLTSPDPPAVREIDKPQDRRAGVAAAAVAGTPVPERAQQPRATSGPAALRPEGDRYGDIGGWPGLPAYPYAPARRAGEPEIGSRTASAPDTDPGLRDTFPEEPPTPPPPPLPFPTPYPVPVPAPIPVPVPVPVPTPIPAPIPSPPVGPLPVPPLETPATPPAPALPSPPPLP